MIEILGLIALIALVHLVRAVMRKTDAYEIKGFIRNDMDNIFIRDTYRTNHIGWINIQTGAGKQKR